MTREQAINYLFSKGFTEEQVSDVVRALTYEPTTKNDLGDDCISRKAAEDITWQDPSYTDPLNILTEVRDKIKELPSVTPQEPTIKALGEELRKARKGITDKRVLIGYNMAVAICNKYLGESEET